MNVLGVCTPNLEFIYCLASWEGSAHDSRVLRDALTRPNGRVVPEGNYYLCYSGMKPCAQWTQFRNEKATTMWANR
ncbi:unnamed protein product [Linum trigynum]|uniref:DDE Tnp4 domain-containing protein n=1 Tax=Linum trigynum TaxID=586398 RepID=A0AAV2C9B8_9ROSI